jgi:glycosyltransferase involved in cell wall biosynthesis
MYTRKKIKVLQCIRQGQVGGGESHLLSLVENLDLSAFEPIVLSFTDGPMIDQLRAANVVCHVISSQRPFDITKWKAVKRLLQENHIDLVHAHGTRAASNVMWAAQRLKIPVIYTIHGWSFHPDQSFAVRKARILSESYITSQADVNISVSASNQKSGKRHIKSFESVIINNGINQQKFNPERIHNDIRKELRIDSQKLLVLFIARFTLQKQPLLALQAFAEALKTNSSMHLLMVGDGDLKDEAVKLAAQLKINDNVTFQPFRADIPDVLAAGDVYLLPSLWEGLPIGLLEGMAMGKTIIASGVDGTTDVIKNNINGLLVRTGNVNDFRDALLAVAGDAFYSLMLQQNAKTTITDLYNAATMTRHIEDLYVQLFTGAKSTRWSSKELQTLNA